MRPCAAIRAHVWKTPHSAALLIFTLTRNKELRGMKGFLIGLGVTVVVIGAGFAALLALAQANAPEPQEVRIEVSDELRR